MNYAYLVAGKIHTVRLEREGDAFRVSIDGGNARTIQVTLSQAGTIEFDLSGIRKRLLVARAGQTRFVAIGSDVFALQVADRAAQRRATGPGSAQAGSLEAAMPGQVVSVEVREGAEVTKGQTLVILEAMKLELRVQAPFAGRVQRVMVEPGQVVERGQQLVELSAS